MASALAHPLFRTSGIDHGLHSSVSGISDNDLNHYHTTGSDARITSPLPAGPMFLKDISRSSSGSTQGSGSMGHLLFQPNFHTRSASLSAGRAEEYNRQQLGRGGLPGLNALASLAGTRDQQILRSFSTTPTSNMQYSSMPAVPTPGISGNNNMPPVCQNCETSTTPLWRRDESGSVLCNACGLFLKLHGRPRPISLKTDVIKSRNRVKTANQGPKKQHSLPASQSVDVMQNGAHRRVSEMSALSNLPRSQSPISRTGTPSLHHDPNIAPQHLFDGVSLQDHSFQAPALPNLGSHPSPGSLSFNDQSGDSLMNVQQLIAQNTLLKTRVSELEVINMMYSDNENTLRKERDEAVRAHEDLKRRFEELERSVQGSDLAHPNKKPRTEDVGAEGQLERTSSHENLASAVTNER